MLTSIDYKKVYVSLHDDILNDFIIPSYRESISYKRASGYFSLNSLLAAIEGIIPFVLNGGNIKIICSPHLTDNDIKFIEMGNKCTKELANKRLLEAIQKYELSSNDIDKLDIICNLIASGKLEIKIAYMETGLFHDKFGIFTDAEENKFYFNGSMNDTFSGMFHNSEVVVTMRSWLGDLDDIIMQENYFNNLWNDKESIVKIFDFPDALKNELFDRFRESNDVQTAIEKYINNKNTGVKKYTIAKYQEAAIQSFLNNDCCQFYEMATGTGKTYTSVKTIEKLHEKIDNLYVLICVPQTELLYQWKKELLQIDYENPNIIGGNNLGNKADNLFYESLISYKINKNMVITISTYDKFFADYYDKVAKIDNLLFIVDEAHNLSPNQINKLPINAKYRLGLSATMERYDLSETNAILSYFTLSRMNPYKYSIDEAIANGFLVHYEYHPIEVIMNEDDFDKYSKYTHKIIIEQNQKEPDEQKITDLKMQRSLIVKQCNDKIDKLVEMVNSSIYSFKNSVIYCGQGTNDDVSIIDNVTEALSQNRKYAVQQYTSKTIERQKVLSLFEMGYYDCLIAIKCFDEGVDVPPLDKIYIMASDASLKQTVQRRGRVLRNCKKTDKNIAYIYDMIMIPPKSEGVGVKSLVANELIRIKEYSRLANHKETLFSYIDMLKKKYSITDDDYEN